MPKSRDSFVRRRIRPGLLRRLLSPEANSVVPERMWHRSAAPHPFGPDLYRAAGRRRIGPIPVVVVAVRPPPLVLDLAVPVIPIVIIDQPNRRLSGPAARPGIGGGYSRRGQQWRGNHRRHNSDPDGSTPSRSVRHITHLFERDCVPGDLGQARAPLSRSHSRFNPARCSSPSRWPPSSADPQSGGQ